MRIHLDRAGITLRASEDFSSLSVQLAGMDFDRVVIARELEQAGIGSLDVQDVLVSIEWLRRSGPRSADWMNGLSDMVEFARTRGWVFGDAVRAHIEVPQRVTSFNPRTGESTALGLWHTTSDEVDDVVSRAQGAVTGLEEMGRSGRARFLRAAVAALEAHRDNIVAIADRESAIGTSRLNAELTRTMYQIEVFAELLAEGAYLEAVIDHAGETSMGPRPDLRRMLLPIGPVAVFGSSNFPLAFSVAGGDTVSALAAGCPVVVKAHSSHPELSSLVARLLREAAADSGCPDGTISIVFGQAAGLALVAQDGIEAASFTGSLSGGNAIQRAISQRSRPIPFFGELSSLNTVVVMPGAAAARVSEIASAIAESVLTAAGQLCTKPGQIFLPEGDAGDAIVAELTRRFTDHPGATLLNRNITSAYESTAERLRALEPPIVMVEGSREASSCGVAARLVVSEFDGVRDELLEECFGPFTVLVRWKGEDALVRALRGAPGALTFTVHAEQEDHVELYPLLALMERRAGRIIYNGMPTGVHVTWAQTHGGPWPATNSQHTSVGPTAIRRFLRPVTWQNVPIELVPADLRDDAAIPVRVDGSLRIPSK